MKKLTGIILAAVLLLSGVAVLSACSTQHTVTYYHADGTVYRTTKTDSGCTAYVPGLTDKDTFLFAGWYFEDGEPFDSTMPVYEDYKIYAKNLLDTVMGSVNTYTLEEVDSTIAFTGIEQANEVQKIWVCDNGYVLLTQVNYGEPYYKDNNPYQQVLVGIDLQGKLTGVRIYKSAYHTAEYLEMLTTDYLDGAYNGNEISASLEVEPMAGASYSSDTTLFAVQTASNYVNKKYGLGKVVVADDSSIRSLKKTIDGDYEKLDIDASFSTDKAILKYVAKVTSGNKTYAAFIINSVPRKTDPNSTESATILHVFVDTATNKVSDIRIFSNGVFADFVTIFSLPDDVMNLYKTVTITNGKVFDGFEEVILQAPETILTSASGSFPDTTVGATEGGTDTSLAIRDTFSVIAEYYTEYFK